MFDTPTMSRISLMMLMCITNMAACFGHLCNTEISTHPTHILYVYDLFIDL